MSGAVSLPVLGRAVQAHLADAGTSLLLRDRATGQTLELHIELAGDPAGLLPVFLVAGEAVWREATGKGFALRVVRDPAALLGYRVASIGAGTFCTVMLNTMEAVEQAREQTGVRAGESSRLLVNELLGSVWQAVLDRADQGGPLANTPVAAATAAVAATATASASHATTGAHP